MDAEEEEDGDLDGVDVEGLEVVEAELWVVDLDVVVSDY